MTANTTLRTNATSLVTRMATFETTWLGAEARVCGNLARIAAGLTPNHNNGISATLLNTSSAAALANPYYGQFWGSWQNSNIEQIAIDPSANGTIDNFFRAVFAPDSVVSGVRRYIQGQVLDVTTIDYGHHDVVRTNATWGTIGNYPKGWGGRGSATGNDLKYSAGRTGDDHYDLVDAGGVRDQMNGRHAQRLVVMCLAALLDPTHTVTIDVEAPRSVNIVTLCDQTMATMANYIVEPTTKTSRWSAPRWLGASNPKLVDSAFTGYLMMATELYLLVKAGASYGSYYPIGTW